jgi:hypothetical protein
MANERRRRPKADVPPRLTTENRPLPAVNDDTVRGRAYEIYEARGSEPGDEWKDWLQAERELRPKREDR